MGKTNYFLKKFRIFLNFITLLLLIVIIDKPLTYASDVIGDINGDGIVSLEESIYALRVVAGINSATILDPSSGPRRAAWGTYSYIPDTLTMDIGFSNFDNAGPPTGQWQFATSEITETTLTVGTRTFTRTQGAAGDIVGKWIFTDADDNIQTLILDQNGELLFTATGPMFSEIVEVPTVLDSSIVIDGSFNDWSGVSELGLYDSQSNCESDRGHIITNVSVAQDTYHIYVMMVLDGTYDNDFNYYVGDDLFKIRVSPSSSDCGFRTDIGSENTGEAQFNNNMLECKVDKCLIKNAWNKAGYDIKASSAACKSTSNLSLLVFDFSACPY